MSNELDKGLERELGELGLSGGRPLMLPQDEARDMGVKCLDCWSPKTVYFISNPIGHFFKAGGYCYDCLLKRCRVSRMIPFPIEQGLLNRLKLGMGLQINTPPKRIF